MVAGILLFAGALVWLQARTLPVGLSDAAPAAGEPRMAWAFHNPPLLLLPGEPTELRFELVCPAAEEPSGDCPRDGEVHIRRLGEEGYTAVPLRQGGEERQQRLFAPVPPSYLEAGGFAYYAALRAGDEELVLPSGGGQAPYRAWVASPTHTISLPPHAFDAPRPPDAVVATATWGSGPGQIGLDDGSERLTIGPSSFDVAPDGTVAVLDPLNRRMVRATPGGTVTEIGLDVSSALPDLALGDDGSVYVLESSAPDGQNALLKEFEPDGTLRASTRIAEPIPSKVRVGPDGPLVQQLPSAMWMPAQDPAGTPLATPSQIRAELASLPHPGGLATVAKATQNELRIALLQNDTIVGYWRVLAPPGAAFGEIQLVEPLGVDLLVAAAVWTEDRDGFRVLRVAAGGLVEDFPVERAGWTQLASGAHFRVGPDADLYQLRTSPDGAQVVRFQTGGVL